MKITREMAEKVRDVVAAGLSEGLGQAKPGFMCVEAAVCYALGLPHGDDPGCVDPALRRLKIRLNDAAWPSKKARAAGLRRLAIAQLGSKGTIDTTKFVSRVTTVTIQTVVPVALRAAARLNPKHEQSLEAAALKCEQEPTIEFAHAAVDAATAAAADAAAYAAGAAGAAADAADAAAAAAAAADAATAAAAAADAATAAAYAGAYAAAADAAAYAAGAAGAAADAAHANILSEFAESVVQILIDLKAPGCEFLDLVPLEDC